MASISVHCEKALADHRTKNGFEWIKFITYSKAEDPFTRDEVAFHVDELTPDERLKFARSLVAVARQLGHVI